MNIEEYFKAWDPYGLIVSNENEDEYSKEVSQIKERYAENMQDSDVGKLIYDVLLENFEHDFPGLQAECIRRSGLIKNLLHK
jgi:hypothetical protein